jgi:pimeloyl-ACP methyl ester carboxylesterase
MTDDAGRLVPVHDTRLYVVERGNPDGLPLILLHGGPGLDHHEFADYLDPLGEKYRLVFVDQRAQGRSDRSAPERTWTLHQMASDVSAVAADLGAERYALLGHSYGAFVALQHAVDGHGAAVATIVSGGVPSMRFLDGLDETLATFEPADLRAQVVASWEREQSVTTEEECAAVFADQLPFHFADPRDPRIADYLRRIAPTVYAPAVLRHFAADDGGIEVEAQLAGVDEPLLACTGRHDRICTPAAATAIAEGVPNGELAVFEESGHMTFVEETERYLSVVADFLDRATGTAA